MIVQNFTCSLKSAKTAHKKTRLGTNKILRTKFKSKKRKLNLKSEKPTVNQPQRSRQRTKVGHTSPTWIEFRFRPTTGRSIYFLYYIILLFSSAQQLHEFSALRRIDSMIFISLVSYISQDFSVGFLHTGA